MARKNGSGRPVSAGASRVSPATAGEVASPEGSANHGEEAGRLHEEIFRLREEAAHLRKEAASLQERAAHMREEAAGLRVASDARMALLREANGKLVAATVHAQTMTEVAERANQEKEQFLAMLAHELRNPLAPIVNALAVLRRVTAAEPTLPWVHDVVKRQVDHMTLLLNDLLEVSRVTSGKISLQKRLIAVSEFMLHAIETCRPLIHDRSQNFTINMPPQPLTIDGDPTRLAQIFSNLLNNAAKYTPERGSIIFSAKQQGEKVVLRVTDDGCGIAAVALPRIFDLFTQEGRSLARAQGGLGIGLTVVRGLVELHGGTIEASSRGLDQGSEFVVTFPLVRNLPLGLARAGQVEMASPGPCFRIALIEDNVDASESMEAVLRIMGHEVSTAFDGDAGFALIQEGKPQIVLCDIGLPGMDGYQVIARLRKEMKSPLPIMIALTGYGNPEDRMRALEAGFDHHLTKPVDVEALLRLIATQGERVFPIPHRR